MRLGRLHVPEDLGHDALAVVHIAIEHEVRNEARQGLADSRLQQIPGMALDHLAQQRIAVEAHPIHASYLQRVPAVGRYYRHFLPLFPSAIEDFDLGAYDLILSTSHCT